MIVLLKIVLIALCGLIAFQDVKERMVSWLLFPIMGITLGLLYLNHTSFEQFYPFVIANLMLVTVIILILFLYTKYIAKKEFLNVSFGLGDLLFFYGLALGFPTITFLVLFAVSILFSLGTSFFLRRMQQEQTIPLAGLMGLFFGGIMFASLFPNVPSLYSI